MVLSKVKAGTLPPHMAGAEQTSVASSSKQVPPIEPVTAGKSTKKMVVKSGVTESRSDQHTANASARRSSTGVDAASCTGQSTSAPSVGASLATEGSQRSAVRITRSSGIKKSSSKVKKGKAGNKSKVTEEQPKSKKLSNGRALPPRHSKGEKAASGKRATKKAPTPTRTKSKQTTKKNARVRGDEVREAPEKNISDGTALGAHDDGKVTPSKPGGVLKGCKSDDNDRNDAMENGVKAIGASKTDGGIDANPTAGSKLWSVASGDMTQVQSYLSQSYRSFEGGALKMKESLVHDSKTGLQDIGRSASEWGETKKVELTENVIPTLFGDGKMFITQALGAITAGCGAMVNPDANAKEDRTVNQNDGNVPAEVESANDTSREKQDEKESIADTDHHHGKLSGSG